MIKPEPSKPIDKEDKEKKDKETKDKTKKFTSLLNSASVPVSATITAGGFVAEIDSVKIRKNSLRLGN